jgi:hypothetical protein
MCDVSSLVLEMSLSGGSVQRVGREVRLAMVGMWGVPVRLMTMGRMPTLAPNQCWRMALARGYICRESCERCGRGFGPCNISIPLSESFRSRSTFGVRSSGRQI